MSGNAKQFRLPRKDETESENCYLPTFLFSTESLKDDGASVLQHSNSFGGMGLVLGRSRILAFNLGDERDVGLL